MDPHYFHSSIYYSEYRTNMKKFFKSYGIAYRFTVLIKSISINANIVNYTIQFNNSRELTHFYFSLYAFLGYTLQKYPRNIKRILQQVKNKITCSISWVKWSSTFKLTYKSINLKRGNSHKIKDNPNCAKS